MYYSYRQTDVLSLLLLLFQTGPPNSSFKGKRSREPDSEVEQPNSDESMPPLDKSMPPLDESIPPLPPPMPPLHQLCNLVQNPPKKVKFSNSFLDDSDEPLEKHHRGFASSTLEIEGGYYPDFLPLMVNAPSPIPETAPSPIPEKAATCLQPPKKPAEQPYSESHKNPPDPQPAENLTQPQPAKKPAHPQPPPRKSRKNQIAKETMFKRRQNRVKITSKSKEPIDAESYKPTTSCRYPN